jgi:hypothetical protein
MVFGGASVFMRTPGAAMSDHPQSGRFMASSRRQRAAERAERESAAVEKLVAKLATREVD